MLKIFLGKNEKLIPKKWYEITIGQYQRLATLELDETTESVMEVINVFTDLSIDTMENMELGEFQKLSVLASAALLDFKNRKQKLVKDFMYNSNKYTLVKNFYKISTNDFMGLEFLLKKGDIEHIHKIIPILYKNSKLKLDDSAAKELSCSIALSALDFIKAHVRS